jgi:excisionase family DNA binding protein
MRPHRLTPHPAMSPRAQALWRLGDLVAQVGAALQEVATAADWQREAPRVGVLDNGGKLFLRRREAAEACGLSIETIDELIRRGELEARTVGTARLIPVAALAALGTARGSGLATQSRRPRRDNAGALERSH